MEYFANDIMKNIIIYVNTTNNRIKVEMKYYANDIMGRRKYVSIYGESSVKMEKEHNGDDIPHAKNRLWTATMDSRFCRCRRHILR